MTDAYEPSISRYIPPNLIVQVSERDGGVLFPRSGIRDMRNLDLDSLSMKIRRRGTDDYVLTYPAWQFDEDRSVQFLFDSDFFDLDFGRYDGVLVYDGLEVGRIEIKYVPAPSVRAAKPAPLKRRVATYPSAPESVGTMYAEVQSFSAPITAVLEIGSVNISLEPSDVDDLDVVLAEPVQLQLSDGVRSELVSFAGLTGGAVIVERAVGGTTQQRFPVGSTLSFVWTEANIANAEA